MDVERQKMDFAFWQKGEPMSDLIDRKLAIDAIYRCTDIYVGNLPIMVDKEDAYKAIAQLPSADVVEVVRCKDCKYYDPKECCIAFGHWFGEVNMIPMGFCSLAERREE